MAPGYRNQNRRQNRTGYVDHDVFEGLPVRHWRRDFVTVAPPPSPDTSTSLNDIWAVELPHGMPKDYHLLPQHSQDLLRGARSGRIYKRPAPVEEDEIDIEGIVPEKLEKKEDETKDKGFQAKAWKQVPRHLEGPDLEYLSKRKKNIITVGAKPKAVPTVTKATMKRIDAAGNEYVQDVIVSHGQRVEGEIISQTEIPDPSAVADVTILQPTPTKRKPTSRKKVKGPGRGRKKKLVAPTSAPIHVEGASDTKPVATVEGIKTESDGSVPPTQNEDTDMQDGSAAASENDESEDDEGDDDEGSVEGSPSKPPKLDSDLPPLPTMEMIPDLPPDDTHMTSAEVPMRSTLHLDDKPKSGSPLKQVALLNSALVSPIEESQETEAPAVELQKLDAEMQEFVELAPSPVPAAPPAPTDEVVAAVVDLRKAEEDEEEMLLDIEKEVDIYRGMNAEPIDDKVTTLDPAAVEEDKDIGLNLEAVEEKASVLKAEAVEEKTLESNVDVLEEQASRSSTDVVEEKAPTSNADVVEEKGSTSSTDIVEEEASTSEREAVEDKISVPTPEEEVSKKSPKEIEPIAQLEAKDEARTTKAAGAEVERDDDFPDILGDLEKSLGRAQD